MRIVLDDDDDDGSDWSLEIFDGIRTNKSTKPIKQTHPTKAGSHSDSGPKPSPKDVHPFFSRDFSTKVTVSANQLITGPEATEQTLGARRTLAPVFAVGRCPGRTTSATNINGKPASQIRPHPSLHAHETQGGPPPDNPRLKNKRPSHQTVPLTKNPSSSSSTQNSFGSKTSEEESSLPVYSFLEYRDTPTVVYTKSESEANALVQSLKGPLGFDLEWRVVWCPGVLERRAALVQLCDYDTILLIQVSSMKRFPRKVLEVIESPDVVKLGANILNDGEKLYRDFGIRARGLVELGALATKTDAKFSSVYNRKIVSLAKMVAMYLGRTLPKGKVRTSNWEANLSREMIEYAANDCHCALMVYDRLQGIAIEAGHAFDALACARHVDPHSIKFKSPTLQTGPGPGTGALAKPPLLGYCIPEPPRPQQLRAYKFWNVDRMSLNQMCMKLRTGDRVEPLKESTVISYVVGALQGDPRLPFDMDRLEALVRMEAGSWQRHREWIASRKRRVPTSIERCV